MSDIVLNNGMNANANVDSDHASASAGATGDAALRANENGATYEGALDTDVAYAADPPELPDLPTAAGEAQATVEGKVNEVHAEADAALEAAGGAPDLPDLGGVDGELAGAADLSGGETGFDVGAAFEGAFDVMGHLLVEFSGVITSVLGF